MSYSTDDLLKPLLYRDIIGPENTPMGSMYGLGYMGGMGGIGQMGMMPQTNLLGGITMQPGLTNDVFTNYQIRKKKDMGFLRNTLIFLAGMTAVGLMRFKGLKNLFSKSGGGFWTKFKKFLGFKTPAPAPAPAPAKKGNWFSRLFHRKPKP